MRRVVLAVTAALLLPGCSAPSAEPPPPVPPPVSSTVPSTVAESSRSTASPAPARRVVVLDPGHNGANAANPAAIARLVPAGQRSYAEAIAAGVLAYLAQVAVPAPGRPTP